jgi:hypothetical protein
MADNGSLRASDQDREAVAEVLRQAHAEGRLDYAELDERLTQTFAARTHGELERLTRDLPREDRRSVQRPPRPAGPAPPARPAGSVPERRRTGPALRTAWYVYTVAVSVNLVVWAAVSLSSRDWTYFWPIWVAGPWGVVLLVTTLFNRSGR